jgi:hypothetical protein
MLIVKVPAVAAVVLFLSSVSAQAMEFADRPGLISAMISSPAATRVLLSDDCSRRQINDRNVLLPGSVTSTKLADRRPGRLSDEFSAVARAPGIRFEYGPGMASSWLKPAAPHIAASSTVVDRDDFTSSLTKTTISSDITHQEGSAESCIGSMAPCGSLSFADHVMISVQWTAFHEERL